MTRHSDEVAARARIVRPQRQPPMVRRIYPAQRLPVPVSDAKDDFASSAAALIEETV